MICLRVLLFATLAVRGLSGMVPDTIPWHSPVTFNYVNEDKLDTNIILLNVPLVAKYYDLYYQTEYCDTSIRTEKHNQQGSQCYVKARTGLIPTNRLILITQNLNRRSITLDIEIRISSNKTCSTKRIMDGLRDAHADKVESRFRACLNNNRSPCKIIVDFKDTCNKANTSHKGKKSQDTSQTPATSSSPEREPSDQTKHYIGTASVVGIIILISLIIYVVIKKCSRKSYDPQQTLQLETHASTNAVLYAELDIGRGNAPPPPSTDDPTYAEIIGVLRPQNQNDKK